MGAGASGARGHAVQKFAVKMFLHKAVQDIAMIQSLCLVENFATERSLMCKL